MRNIAAGTYSRRQSLTDRVESFVSCFSFTHAFSTKVSEEVAHALSTNASDNSYNKHEPTAKGGIRTRACHRKHYVYYMCLVFRSSSYPCKDSNIHHIQLTIAELSCCPVGGVMLPRAPKRRILSKTRVSLMPHASDNSYDKHGPTCSTLEFLIYSMATM